jgi:hypothetical protein
MASNVIPFPVRAVIPALPDFCTEIEEARHMVAKLRANRDGLLPGSRDWQLEQIKLDWWMGELVRVSGVANDNIIPLRRA